MFGRSKPVVFDPYRRQRSRRGIPPWLLLLLTGLVGGAAGVIYLQERHLPPRLSTAESAALRSSFDEADAERRRLAAELATLRARLQGTEAERTRLASELATSQAATQSLQSDLAALVATLPPDPRQQAVAVRAGRFSAREGGLDYSVVFSRAGRGRPFQGVVQISVAGDGRKVEVPGQPLNLRAHEVLHGRIELPEGFRAQEATVRVLDRPGGATHAFRVLKVGSEG
jgi:hypothetical protein